MAAFRGNGAMSWGEHHPCLFAGTEWFFRTGYRGAPVRLMDSGSGRCRSEAQGRRRVADVGCGHGASVVAMADAYPKLDVLWIRLPPAFD